MLLAIDFSSIVSSAVANDDQLGPPFSLTLSSPLNQADIHSRKQSTDCPQQSAFISFSLSSYNPNCRPNAYHTEQGKCRSDVNSLMTISRSLISIKIIINNVYIHCTVYTPTTCNCDSTYYNIPSFIVVNGVLNSSVISITSYTIIIITEGDVTVGCHH